MTLLFCLLALIQTYLLWGIWSVLHKAQSPSDAPVRQLPELPIVTRKKQPEQPDPIAPWGM